MNARHATNSSKHSFITRSFTRVLGHLLITWLTHGLTAPRERTVTLSAGDVAMCVVATTAAQDITVVGAVAVDAAAAAVGAQSSTDRVCLAVVW